MTLETIRTALATADPYEEMERLVLAEMASGRKVLEIFEAINLMLHEVLETPGLSEDGEEAILGTMDKLTGDCLESQCYRDLPVGPVQANGKPAATDPAPVARGA